MNQKFVVDEKFSFYLEKAVEAKRSYREVTIRHKKEKAEALNNRYIAFNEALMQVKNYAEVRFLYKVCPKEYKTYEWYSYPSARKGMSDVLAKKAEELCSTIEECADCCWLLFDTKYDDDFFRKVPYWKWVELSIQELEIAKTEIEIMDAIRRFPTRWFYSYWRKLDGLTSDTVVFKILTYSNVDLRQRAIKKLIDIGFDVSSVNK